MIDEELVKDLAIDIRCGVPLAHDLLVLAGGDASIVRQASDACHGVNSMKAYIIDRRIAKVEEN